MVMLTVTGCDPAALKVKGVEGVKLQLAPAGSPLVHESVTELGSAPFELTWKLAVGVMVVPPLTAVVTAAAGAVML